MEALGLGDAFKMLGSPADARWTWDTFTNKYHEQRFEYVCSRVFHGIDSSECGDSILVLAKWVLNQKNSILSVPGPLVDVVPHAQ